jgi:hypothetical protein
VSLLLNILFGSNRLIGTDIPIIFRDNGKDKELFRYELRDSDSKPLIDVEIRDDKNELLGKVHKSTSFVFVHKDYESKEERAGSDVKKMTLTRKSDNTTIFELIFHKPTDIEVNGVFHIEGFPHPIIATHDVLKIGGITFSHNTIMKRGIGIILTQNGFMM